MQSLEKLVEGLISYDDEEELIIEEVFLACTICKNLCDLCETGICIIQNIKATHGKVEGLPSIGKIKLARSFLEKYYSDDMFLDDEEFGVKPNWEAIQEFDEKKLKTAVSIYRMVKANIGEGEMEIIKKAMQERNSDYFLNNYMDIFKGGLSDWIDFRGFINSPYLTDEDKECMWEFFEQIINIISEEEEMFDILSKMLISE